MSRATRQVSPRSKKHRGALNNPVKRKMVADAIQKGDVAELRSLALSSDGLVDDILRREAWMLLLEIPVEVPLPEPAYGHAWFSSSKEKAKLQATMRQIELDVARSYGHLQNSNSPMLEIKRQSLSILLSQFFSRNPDLCYYQGFHDVAAVCQDIMKDSFLALAVLERLSRFFLVRDAHRKEFDATNACLQMIPQIVSRMDAELGRILLSTSPYWAVSMVITNFAHDVASHESVARIFDVVIASHPIFPVYLTAALVLAPKVAEALKNLEEPDTADIHGLLRRVASKDFDNFTNANSLVALAKSLISQVPPNDIIAWARAHASLTKDSIVCAPFPMKFASQESSSPVLFSTSLVMSVAVLAVALLWRYHYTRDNYMNN